MSIFLDADDIWCQVFAERQTDGSRPALFLDRDGVIVEEVLYLHRVEDVTLLPGAPEAIAAANQRGWLVVVVTNQAGIAHGYYGWKEFEEVQDAILAGLGRRGARLDAVLACPHHPSHPARKPQPGMFLRAAEALNIDLPHSWMVGDKSSDLLAGRAAGLKGGILVMTGHGPAHREAATALRTPEFDVRLASAIGDAVRLLISSEAL